METQTMSRITYLLIAICLGWASILELDKPEGPVWMIIFLVPAVFTMIVACNIKFADRLILKSVMSLYLGCTFSLFVWLLVHFMIGYLVHQTRIAMADPEGDGSMAPAVLRTLKQCILLLGIITWVKFLRSSAKHLLRHENKEPDSARQMLKHFIFLLFPSTIIIVYLFNTAMSHDS